MFFLLFFIFSFVRSLFFFSTFPRLTGHGSDRIERNSGGEVHEESGEQVRADAALVRFALRCGGFPLCSFVGHSCQGGTCCCSRCCCTEHTRKYKIHLFIYLFLDEAKLDRDARQLGLLLEGLF